MSKKKAVFAAGAGILLAAILGTGVFSVVKMGTLSKELGELEKQTKKNGEVSEDLNAFEDQLNKIQTQTSKTNRIIDSVLNVASEMTGIDFSDADRLDWEDLFGSIYGVHEVYDDTAVVDAYRSGDASKLTDEKDLFVLEKVKEIIPQIIKEGMTDYEKEKAVYDWQVAYTTYDEGGISAIISSEEYSHMPYGVLKYHQAICVGQATTFKLFMDCLDIDCMIIHSVQEGEHAWNLVKIDDSWYHVDVMFDSGSGDAPGYDFFNVPDEVKEESGYPWNPEEFPAADSYEYCYFVKESKEADSAKALPKLMKELVDANPARGTLNLSLPEEELEAALYVVENISSLYKGEFTYMELANTAFLNDRVYVRVTYSDARFEDDPDSPVGPENVDYDDLNAEIEKYFSDYGYDW